MKRSKPYIVGLTGGIACGKSHVARFLRDLGVPVLDADKISRALTAPGGEALPAIRAAFGDAVFDGDALNRRALGDVVFHDAEKRRALEGILHPLIIARMHRETEESGASIVGWDVPLLFETGMDALCDETWTLYADRETQIARVTARDGLDREQAEARIDSMMPTEARNARATHAINTDQPMEKTRQILQQLYRAAERRAG